MKIIATVSLIVLSIQGFAFAADSRAGGAAYDKSCKGCHGATGSPNLAIAKTMSVTIAEPGSAEVQGQSDADLIKVIYRR